MNEFKLVSPFSACGDQPEAIDALSQGVLRGDKTQVLLGVTGSGKTFTMAKVIERVQKPTLVIAHNKTLAAQLCAEFKEFFPDSAVEYFVSYYDYYQPEAYIPASDTYIEKTVDINDEIDKLRHSATCALNERRDVIIVASVSCIYALGDPEEYLKLSISLRRGMEIARDEVVKRLVDIQFQRNDYDFTRGTFRVRGDVLDIFPANWSDKALRIEFFGDEVDRISEVSPVTGEILCDRAHVAVFPASHYATSHEKLMAAMEEIERDCALRVEELTRDGKLVEAQRLSQRTEYDLEMMREIGFAAASRTTAAILTAEGRANRRLRSSTIFRRIFCSLWTNRTSRSRRSAPCTAATARARQRSSNTASASRPRSTTVRSSSTNSAAASRR